MSDRLIGWTQDNRQFFLTTPFVSASQGTLGNEFIALFLFDAQGALMEARIDELGPRESLDKEKSRALYNQRLQELGSVRFDRIEVAPFSVERFGTHFGLIPQPPDEFSDQWTVILEPGNCMAFFEPWDSGEYDT